MIEEQNGNNPINVKLSSSMVVPIASSLSNDDLSLSTSEYTDADEMSAPTEYLAEVSRLCSNDCFNTERNNCTEQ